MSQNRPSAPSAFTIASWWLEHQSADRIFVYDIGEPACFACDWYSQHAKCAPDVSPTVAWTSSRLERAHIQPYSMDGSSDPSNFVLLCNTCHREAPDWRDPELMLTWIHNREDWISRAARDFQMAWQALRPEEPFPTAGFDREGFMAALRANATMHRGRVAPATAIAALIEIIG